MPKNSLISRALTYLSVYFTTPDIFQSSIQVLDIFFPMPHYTDSSIMPVHFVLSRPNRERRNTFRSGPCFPALCAFFSAYSCFPRLSSRKKKANFRFS